MMIFMIFMMTFMIIVMSFFHQKILFFCLCMYKMFNTDKETYENNNIEAMIDDTGMLRLNEKHMEEKLGHKNLPTITKKYDQAYKKHRHELVNEAKKQQNRRFLRSDLALRIIMNCKTDEPCNFLKNLGFQLHDVVNTKE